MAWRSALVLLAMGASVALPAGARTYCCTDDNGRRVCGDILPAQCQKRAYQEFNAQGVLTKRHEGPMTAEQRAQRDAEAARRKAEEQRAADDERRNRAMMASYTSTADIDAKRDRMLDDASAGLKLSQERYDAAVARQKNLQQEAEFYRKKPMPDALKANIRDNEAELAAHQTAVTERKKDIEAIRARFEEERKRYLSLGGRQGTAAIQGSKASTPATSKTAVPAKN
jgi:hypothetical protein